MANIYLVRHAKVDGPAALYGETDIGTIAAHEQLLLKELVDNAHLFDHIISSPLKRCKSTALALAKQANIPYTIKAQLTEMNFGDFDGIPFDKIHHAPLLWQQLEKFWQHPAKLVLANAESLNEFRTRVIMTYNALFKDFENQNILIICHGGVIRILLSYILHIDWQQSALYSQLSIANGSVTHINHHDISGISQVKGIAMPLSALTLNEELYI